MKNILKYSAAALLAGLFTTSHANANSMGLTASSSLGGTITGSPVPGGELLGGSLAGWSSVIASGSFASPPTVENQNTLDASSTTASTLTVIYSVTGVTEPLNSSLLLQFTVNNILGGMTVVNNVFVDTGNGGNNLDDTAASLSSLTPIGTMTATGLQLGTSSLTKLAPGTTYSLTEELIITSTANMQTANVTDSATEIVPDGGMTLTLLGGAFCAIAAIRRKIQGS